MNSWKNLAYLKRWKEDKELSNWLWTLAPVQLPSRERAAVLAADARRGVTGHVAAQLLLLQPHTQRQHDVMETLRTRREQLLLKYYWHSFSLTKTSVALKIVSRHLTETQLHPRTSHSGIENSLLPGRNPEQDQGHMGEPSSRGEWATVTDAFRQVHGKFSEAFQCQDDIRCLPCECRPLAAFHWLVWSVSVL